MDVTGVDDKKDWAHGKGDISGRWDTGTDKLRERQLEKGSRGSKSCCHLSLWCLIRYWPAVFWPKVKLLQQPHLGSALIDHIFTLRVCMYLWACFHLQTWMSEYYQHDSQRNEMLSFSLVTLQQLEYVKCIRFMCNNALGINNRESRLPTPDKISSSHLIATLFLRKTLICFQVCPEMFLFIAMFCMHTQSITFYLCVHVDIQLSHTSLGNSMSPFCPEKGNRNLWLELQTLTPPQEHRKKRKNKW